VELYEAMRCAPTTRRFSDEAVSPEVLHRVLENARFAPSGGNRQAWRLVAVQDPDSRRALGDHYLPHWRRYMEHTGGAAILADPGDFDPRRVEMLRRADEFAERIHEIPLHIVVCAKLGDLAIVDAGLDRPSVVAGASIYPFVQNMLLGLRSEGLGCALTTILAPAEPEVRELLAIPEDVVIAAYVVVGHRADPWPAKLARHPVEEFAFSERYGQAL
jgi:nitroreductase